MPHFDWNELDDIHAINAEIERAYARRTELLEEEALAMQARAGELSKATGVPVEDILKLPKKRGPKAQVPKPQAAKPRKGKAASCHHAVESMVSADNSLVVDTPRVNTPRVDSDGDDIAGMLPA